MKKIEGYENYSISEDGRVYNTKFGRNIKHNLNSIGYSRVSLSNKGKQKQLLVHRLVAQAFIPNPNNLPEVNHKDGNKRNNNVDNLEWTTRSENEEHAYRTGLQLQKNTPEQAAMIRFLYSLGGITQKELARIYGVRPQSISYIINKNLREVA